MTTVAISENVHDSCLTLTEPDEGSIALHVELERVSGIKRKRLEQPWEIDALLALALGRRRGGVELVLGGHHAMRLADVIRGRVSAACELRDVRLVDHLDAHAGLAYAFDVRSATVVAIDGGGDARVAVGQPNAFRYSFDAATGLSQPEPLFDAMPELGMDGRHWSLVAVKLFDDPYAAGKVMGLAAYGTPADRWRSALLSPEFGALSWTYDDAGMHRRLELLDVNGFQDGADLCATLQDQFSRSVIEALRPHAPADRELVTTGGCALNVHTNALVREQLAYQRVHVPPCPGDEGHSLGALLYARGPSMTPAVQWPYLGVTDDDGEPDEAVLRQAAVALARGRVLATCVGRSEVGPRALGNRSLLARPTSHLRERVSVRIKGREWFRPVAPIVPADVVSEWFQTQCESPYMTFAVQAKQATCEQAPGIVHVDGSSRVQTVTAAQNAWLFRLLELVGEATGVPLLINTSFNLAGRPIVGYRGDAIRTWVQSDIDGLLFPQELLLKAERD